MLAAVLAKVSAPLSKPDLVLIATASLSQLLYEHAQSLARRHKFIGSETNSASRNCSRVLGEHLKGLDETGLSRFSRRDLIMRSGNEQLFQHALEPLESAANRYRVNTEKIAESVATQFAAKQKKGAQRRASAASRAQRFKPKSVKRKS